MTTSGGRHANLQRRRGDGQRSRAPAVVRSQIRPIIKPLTATDWGTKGFYVDDPDGYIIVFGGRPSGNVSDAQSVNR